MDRLASVFFLTGNAKNFESFIRVAENAAVVARAVSWHGMYLSIFLQHGPSTVGFLAFSDSYTIRIELRGADRILPAFGPV